MARSSVTGRVAVSNRSAKFNRLAVNLNQNLTLKSVDFSGFSMQNISITSNAVGNPFNGAVDGTKLTESGGNTQHYFGPGNPSGAVGDTITASVFAKAINRTWLFISRTGFVGIAYFNLLNGAAGLTSPGAAVKNTTIASIPYGNGWFRCYFTYTIVSSPGQEALFGPANGDGLNSYASTGVDSIYVYGLQIVKANWPGYYTITTGSAITTGIRNVP